MNKYWILSAVFLFAYWNMSSLSFYEFKSDENGNVRYRCNILTGKVEKIGAYHRPTLWSEISGNGTHWHDVGDRR